MFKPFEQKLLEVIIRAWTEPFTTKSRFARNHIDEIAYAASLGLITTVNEKGAMSRTWRITNTGLVIISMSKLD